MYKDTLVLAHYYTTPEVQAMADHVGDSLDLAQVAQREKAKRIVFAGVKFMAETAKILNPDAEVILPDDESSCSLVEQTDVDKLIQWRGKYTDYVHVAYINSSAKHKATADVIVTSRIVVDVIEYLNKLGAKVIFSPDYNMGAYINQEFGYEMPLWTAVCDVHDKFKADELFSVLREDWGIVLAHPESPLPVLEMADFVGSTHGMLNYIKEYNGNLNTIYVATEEGLLHNMRELRPDLNIIQAPVYGGCVCNFCPYMKKNNVDNVQAAIDGTGGSVIDYLSYHDRMDALTPIERMMEFQKTGKIGDLERFYRGN
jgi:quinolinate synthase